VSLMVLAVVVLGGFAGGHDFTLGGLAGGHHLVIGVVPILVILLVVRALLGGARRHRYPRDRQ
jgi:hypothetical protein